MPSLLFDAAIIGFLTIDMFVIGVFMLQFFKHGKKIMTSLAFLLFGFMLISGGVVFYGSFIEPQRIVVMEQSIDLRKDASTTMPHDLSIALVSDFHVGPYKKKDFVEKAVTKINSLKPDMILLAGDFAFGDEPPFEDLEPLKNLSAPLGVFAILGNHDYTESNGRDPEDFAFEGNERVSAIVEQLEKAHIPLLINEVRLLEKNGKKFLLGGVDEIWSGRADLLAITKERAEPLPTILLAHNPDIIYEARNENIYLALAGHTHGGQIRLPVWGSVPRLPTELGRHYDRGLFSFGETQLFITSGIGESGPRARLFVSPEIALLKVILPDE